MSKINPENILKEMIGKAIAMNMMTEHNDDLEDKIKVLQKATAITILEPAFDYMDETGNDHTRATVKHYKEYLDILKEHKIIETIDDVEAEMKKIDEKIKKKQDEKNHDNNE